MTALARVAGTAVLTCTALLLPAAAAAADEPERTGSWNRLSTAGMSLPQPGAQEGDLRVTAGPDAPSAYAAVLYTAPGATGATLELRLREGSAVGTPRIAACPTLTTDWPEGQNQPYDQAPPYDCALGAALAELAEDGTTLTFALVQSTQIESDVWSLALVPDPAATEPFSADLEPPGPGSFSADTPSSIPEPDPTSDDSSTGGSGGSGGGFDEASLDSGFQLPPSVEDTTEVPPLVAGGEAALPAVAAPAPALAATRPPPALLARPAGVVEDLGAGRRLLALVVLAAGSAAVGYAAGQQRPAPRLIGGRARLGTPPLVAAPFTGSAQDRPRGIGRFAKPRDASPRRLR